MGEERKAVIVGAGIVGIAISAFLAEAGMTVTVIDRSGVCGETSAGNAAAFAFSDILPLAHKGMIRHLPGWLADPLGPLSIPPAYLPKLAPWLWRFWRAGSGKNRAAAIAAQTALMELARVEWPALMRRSGTLDMLREDGSLELYESETEFDDALTGWDEREKAGIAFEHVRGGRLAELQPGLSAQFVAGTFVPDWKTVADPKRLADALWAWCETRGARFVGANVAAIVTDDGKPAMLLDDGRRISGDVVVIAAGAWSHLLARTIGEVIPLETERGYNTTFPADAFDLRRQLIFSRHGFVVTPLEDGIRIGGAVEFGGLDRPPNYDRARAMVKKTQRFLPGLKTVSGSEWMGYRPSLPDTLPVIGRSTRANGVYFAFGHGHLGLTQAAATGRLIRDMVFRQAAAIDVSAFRPERF